MNTVAILASVQRQRRSAEIRAGTERGIGAVEMALDGWGTSKLASCKMQKKVLEQAPRGQWGMPEPKLAEWLGYFIMAWSLIEAAIEVGIGKQLGTEPLESSIVTAGLMFRARASILMSLLNRDSSKNAEAISILKIIEQIEDRNDILHSTIGGSASQIWFNRRKTKRKFSSKIERYNQIRLKSTVLEVSDLSARLMAALGISKDEYLSFFQNSHDAVSNQ